MDTFISTLSVRRTRRTHSAEFKANVIRACGQAGVSMAAVALANGINANLLRKWVIDAERQDMAPVNSQQPTGARCTSASGDPIEASDFVSVRLPPPTPAPVTPQDIRVEVHRAGVVVTVTWPVSAAAECAAWMREIMR